MQHSHGLMRTAPGSLALVFLATVGLADDLPTIPNRQEFRIRLLNSDSEPVAGAQVTAWALGSSQGHGIWSENLHGPLTILQTDADGLANVPFPRYHFEQSEVSLVSVRIEHPEYCWANEHLTLPDDRSEPVTVTLQRGTRLRIGLVTEDGDALLAAGHILIHADVLQGTQFHEDDEHWHASNPLPDRWRALRGVVLPNDAPPQFTNLAIWSTDDAQTHEMLLVVQPGVRVEGRIDDSVPRPVMNGRAIVCVTDPVGFELSGRISAAVWQDVVEIAEDGSFVFESLPRGCDAQIMALCDGYLSRSPTAQEVLVINSRYGLSGGLGASFTVPQMFNLTGDILTPEIAMSATGSMQVKVVDQNGQPVPGAVVAFWPNQYWFGVGSNILGTAHCTTDVLQSRGTYTFHPQNDYSAETDGDGVATIHRFPGGHWSFVVELNGQFLKTIVGDQPQVTVVPGEIVHQQVMVTVGEQVAD